MPESTKTDPNPDFKPRFRIRHLEIFWAVMRTGSQHEAAELLGLSQPAVSKLLRHLEDQVGVPLFLRSKGRLIPTPEARVFLQAVEEVFGRVEAAERLARDIKRGFGSRILIVAVPGLSATFLPQALSGFLLKRPEIRVAVTAHSTGEIVERVLKQQADIGLVYGPIEATIATTSILCHSTLVCALPPDHRLAARPTLTPADLAGERIISVAYMPRWGQIVEEAFAAAGVTRNIVVNCANSDFAFSLAVAGVGIAVMPMAPLHPDLAHRVAIRRFEPRITLPVLAVYGGNAPLPALNAELIDWLRDAASTQLWDVPLDGQATPMRRKSHQRSSR